MEEIVGEYVIQGGFYDGHLAVVYGERHTAIGVMPSEYLGFQAKIMVWKIDPNTFKGTDANFDISWVPQEEVPPKPLFQTSDLASKSLEDHVIVSDINIYTNQS